MTQPTAREPMPKWRAYMLAGCVLVGTWLASDQINAIHDFLFR